MDWLMTILQVETQTELWWVLFGLAAQLMFTARFLVQWIASERAGRSYVPVAFWYLSLVGAAMMFFYAIHREEPIFLIGQGLQLYLVG